MLKGMAPEKVWRTSCCITSMRGSLGSGPEQALVVSCRERGGDVIEDGCGPRDAGIEKMRDHLAPEDALALCEPQDDAGAALLQVRELWRKAVDSAQD